MNAKALRGLIVLATAYLISAVPAFAVSYNYMFPDGSPGFAVMSRGGVVNPVLLVGFNPQPEPPALPDATIMLGDGTEPLITQPATTDSYTLVMSVIGSGIPTLGHPPEPVMPAGAAASTTSLMFTAGGHDFVLSLALTGPGAVINWVSFNPQPEPPAQWFGQQFSFSGLATDPTLSFSLTEDGDALSFALVPTPLPATLPLLVGGLGVLGFCAQRRRRKMA